MEESEWRRVGSKEAEKEDPKEEAARKGPWGSGGGKGFGYQGAVLDLREDRSQVSGVQRVRGWRRGARSGCSRCEQPE